MVKNSYIYNRPTGARELKTTATSQGSPYFDPGNVRFFGAKLEKIYTNDKRDKYVFTEKYTNSPDGKVKYKVGIYDSKKNKFDSSDLYENKKDRDELFSDVRKRGTGL